jgi:hypothetical protein
MIVALAIRLADWLMQSEFRSLTSATSTRGQQKKTKAKTWALASVENP